MAFAAPQRKAVWSNETGPAAKEIGRPRRKAFVKGAF
jgi:hypothetical protein